MIGFLVVCAVCLGGYVAWTIGANDVANAVGTVVGSKALTLRNAVIIAAIFEFIGAFFLGSHVSETLGGEMLDLRLFEGRSFDYVFGMLAALFATGVWLQLSSYMGLPVSTTHTIVGAVVGFGLVEGGIRAVVWPVVGSVAFSWILSPVIGGIVSYILFRIVRFIIFFQEVPFERMKKGFPWMVFLIFFVMLSIILYRDSTPLGILLTSAYALIGGGVCGGIGWWAIRKSTVRDQWEGVERLFGYLQVIIACFMSFAHGSNDVANAIGPLIGVINVLYGYPIIGDNPMATWFLLLGGVGIVVGLVTWGWRVIATVGTKITELTPSRGFIAGFASAITIVVASKLGMPISTTHVVVGSVLGVGFARGLKSIDLKTVVDIGVSWVLTIPAGAVLCALIFYVIRLFL